MAKAIGNGKMRTHIIRNINEKTNKLYEYVHYYYRLILAMAACICLLYHRYPVSLVWNTSNLNQESTSTSLLSLFMIYIFRVSLFLCFFYFVFSSYFFLSIIMFFNIYVSTQYKHQQQRKNKQKKKTQMRARNDLSEMNLVGISLKTFIKPGKSITSAYQIFYASLSLLFFCRLIRPQSKVQASISRPREFFFRL